MTTTTLYPIEPLYELDEGSVSGGVFDFLDTVYLGLYATGGTGTVLDPYTGWEAAVAAGSGKQYIAGVGHWAKSSSLDLGALSHIHIQGQGSNVTFFDFTGAGNGFIFGVPAPSTTIRFGIHMSGCTIRGNTGGTSTVGIEAHFIADSSFTDVKIINFATDAVHLYGGVAIKWDGLRVVGNEGDEAVRPANAFVADRRSVSEVPTTQTFVGCSFDQYTTNGFWQKYGGSTNWTGGTIEGSIGAGVAIRLDAGVGNCNFTTHVESSTGGSMVVGGFQCTFTGFYTPDYYVTVTGTNNSFFGGYMPLIAVSGNYNAWYGTTISTFTNTASKPQTNRLYACGNILAGGIPTQGEGIWMTRAYSGADFSANTGTWTVTALQRERFRYVINGNRMEVNVGITGSSISATPTYLVIVIPEGLATFGAAEGTYWYADNSGVWQQGLYQTNGTLIQLYRNPDLTPWPAGAVSLRGLFVVDLNP